MTPAERIASKAPIRPCVACRHHTEHATSDHADRSVNHVCTHPIVNTDLVTGRVSQYGTPCVKARAADGRCGIEARLWDAA